MIRHSWLLLYGTFDRDRRALEGFANLAVDASLEVATASCLDFWVPLGEGVGRFLSLHVPFGTPRVTAGTGKRDAVLAVVRVSFDLPTNSERHLAVGESEKQSRVDVELDRWCRFLLLGDEVGPEHQDRGEDQNPECEPIQVLLHYSPNISGGSRLRYGAQAWCRR